MKTLKITTLISSLLLAITVQAGEVGTVTSFTANTPAKASEVNANFTALITAINDNANRIAALEGASSSSVSGHTYAFIGHDIGLAASDGVINPGGWSRVNATVLKDTWTFNADGATGTINVLHESEAELLPGTNQLIDRPSGPPELENFTYTQTGSVLTLTFADGFSETITVSSDGSTMILPLNETDLEPENGPNAKSIWKGLAIGIRTN